MRIDTAKGKEDGKETNKLPMPWMIVRNEIKEELSEEANKEEKR